MILEETLNKLIRDVIDLLLATPGYTIKGKQLGAPRPTGAYADVNFVTDVNLGWEQRTFENNGGDDDLTETIEGQRSVFFSINFYRSGATDNSRKVRTGFIRESIQALFISAGVGLTTRSDVRDLDEALENGWEERSQFDLTVNVVGSDSDVVRSILSVDMAGVFEARGLQYNFNIEVE